MKRILLFLSLFLALTSFTSLAGLDDIINAIKTSNSAQIAKEFDNTVEISLPSKSNTYSKGQAEVILKDFFAMAGAPSLS